MSFLFVRRLFREWVTFTNSFICFFFLSSFWHSNGTIHKVKVNKSRIRKLLTIAHCTANFSRQNENIFDRFSYHSSTLVSTGILIVVWPISILKPSLSSQWSLVWSFVRDFFCISFVWLCSQREVSQTKLMQTKSRTKLCTRLHWLERLGFTQAVIQ